tara:strand:- start:18104 stop:18238 length:135 start_codon:yes stop_codon:yes gene_type:complete
MIKKYQKINLDITRRLKEELIYLPRSLFYGKNNKFKNDKRFKHR